jgi:hypothetical protein
MTTIAATLATTSSIATIGSPSIAATEISVLRASPSDPALLAVQHLNAEIAKAQAIYEELEAGEWSLKDTLPGFWKRHQDNDDWYRRAGLLELHHASVDAWVGISDLEEGLTAFTPTTAAGAAALLSYVSEHLKGFEAEDWTFPVMENIVNALRSGAVAC